MNRNNKGFSLIETAIVMMVGAVIVQMTVSASGPVMNRMAVSSASVSLASLHARARAHAIELGRVIQLRVDPTGDSAWISDAGQSLETWRLTDDSGVDLQARASVSLCFNARGTANTECNSFSDSMLIKFERGNASSSVVLLPLGQLIKQ